MLRRLAASTVKSIQLSFNDKAGKVVNGPTSFAKMMRDKSEKIQGRFIHSLFVTLDFETRSRFCQTCCNTLCFFDKDILLVKTKQSQEVRRLKSKILVVAHMSLVIIVQSVIRSRTCMQTSYSFSFLSNLISFLFLSEFSADFLRIKIEY
jgi:hypothetical protein